MMRRSLLGLLPFLAMRGDGLVPPMNAPPAGALAYGVQPGAQSPVVLANTVIIFGPSGASSGMFVYQGAPAAGSLIASVAPAPGGVDRFGNAIEGGGFATYSAAAGVATLMQNNAIQFLKGPVGGGGPWTGNGDIGAGGTGILELDAASTAIITATQLGLATPSFTAETSALLEVQGTGAFSGAVSAIVGGALETWHPMSLLNNWANVAGFATARYRKNALNRVEVIANINAAAATNAQFFTVPAAYIPASQQPVGAAGANASVPAGLAPWCRVDTSGNLTVQNTGAVGAAWQFFLQGSYSLDA